MDNQLMAKLNQKYNIVFKDIQLLEQAFMHSSYVNEHRHLKLTDNERLEFLGDAVLDMLISQYLYQKYTDMTEGKLTKMRSAIVREDSLSQFAKDCQFDQYIYLGKGEEGSGGRNRPSLLCDLFEAFLGALYLDSGLETVMKFIAQVIFPKIDAGVFDQEVDYKTQLQEVLQRQGDVKIDYHLIAEEGPAHERLFFTEVLLNGQVIGTGKGRSKKLSEQDAAQTALQTYSEESRKE